MSALVNGKLVDKKVTQKIYSKLHKGSMSSANAIVAHQTGATTVYSTMTGLYLKFWVSTQLCCCAIVLLKCQPRNFQRWGS